MALITETDIENFALVDFSANYSTVDTSALIAAATGMVEEYLGRRLEYTTSIAETFDGGVRSVQVERWPINVLTSVVENGVTLTSGTDYQADLADGIIHRTGGSGKHPRPFKPYLRTVVVTYNGGYEDGGATGDDVPEAITYTLARICGRLFRAGAPWIGATGGQAEASSLSLDGVGSVTYRQSSTGAGQAGAVVVDTVSLLPDEMAVLAPYRNVGLV